MKSIYLKGNRRIFLTLFILFLAIPLLGCTQPDIEGIVIRREENYIQIATDLTIEEYEQIPDPTRMQDEDILGDTTYGLVDLSYKYSKDFNPGDQVKVWTKGGIRESYPASADAKKIRHK